MTNGYREAEVWVQLCDDMGHSNLSCSSYISNGSPDVPIEVCEILHECLPQILKTSLSTSSSEDIRHIDEKYQSRAFVII